MLGTVGSMTRVTARQFGTAAHLQTYDRMYIHLLLSHSHILFLLNVM
jgi:hypothetical protein